MSNSLLAHLYSKIKGSQEDVATMALHYLISQSIELNRAFTHLLASSISITLEDSLQYYCQSVGERKERPDMVGIDKNGNDSILCEIKFYAGLTYNQPLGYIDRLKSKRGQGLVFICPKARKTNLWSKLTSLCNKRQTRIISSHCIDVDGVRMSILTWDDILTLMHHVSVSSARELLSDVHQLKGFCDQMDTDAFFPFAPEELSAENAKRVQRYYDVIDETTERIRAISNISVSKVISEIKTTYYEKKVYIGNTTVSIIYDRSLWKSNSSLETPFWFSIYDYSWQEHRATMAKIPAEKVDDTVYSIPYFALVPLTDATFDEVCEDLMCQVLDYFILFSIINNAHTEGV